MARTRKEPAAHPICCLDAYRRSRMAPCSGRSPAEIREQGCRHSAICLHQYAGSWCCTCVQSRRYDEGLNAFASRSVKLLIGDEPMDGISDIHLRIRRVKQSQLPPNALAENPLSP